MRDCKLEIEVQHVPTSSVQITIFIDDVELGQKILENIKKNIWLIPCKNCLKLFIVNSATHVICWRCRNKDRESPEPVEL